MNQYRCETCKNEDCEYHPMWIDDMNNFQKLFRLQIAYVVSEKGCASHSDFQSNREKVLNEAIINELRDFDMWFSMRHVCGQSPIIPEVRQELHRRMRELRQEDVVEKHTNQPQPEIEKWQPVEPDYKDCPCWISPCDPDECRGTCQTGGDCKRWHHIPYEKCDRFQKGCADCLDEPLCKFRITELRNEGDKNEKRET